jgi:hypothetical protein
MKLLYEEQGNQHKIYGDALSYPLLYCIYAEHKDYKAKDRDDGLIYIAGFKTKKEAWDYYQKRCKI